MKIKISVCAFLLLANAFWACTGSRPATVAGPEGYTCFTGLNATRSEITRALLLLYEKHPENRIDYNYILETGLINPGTTGAVQVNAAGIDSLEREYFNGLKDHLKPDGTWGERWRLKTSDGKIGYSLTTEFCDTTGRQQCDLCLAGQLRKADLDGSRNGSFQFSKKEKRQLVAYLEQDLVEKLRQIIEEERRKK